MTKKEIALSSLRVLIGVYFVVTAVLKILSIREFELYIYSYDLFGFTLCTIFARCVIVFEMLVGICLALRFWYRLTWWLMQLSLIGFICFLVVAYFRGDSNCHCLGDFVELDPLQSMLKNVVTMLLLILVKKQNNWHFRYEKVLKAIVCASVVVIPFIVTPPELLYGKIYSTSRDINTIEYQKALSDSTFLYKYPTLSETEILDSTTFFPSVEALDCTGKQIFVFAHAGCKYCKQGVKKLALIFSQNKINKGNCKIFIFGNSPKHIYKFIKETDSYGFEYREISPVKSIGIIDGKFPTFVFAENAEIKSSIDLWGLEEDKIIDFFNESNDLP